MQLILAPCTPKDFLVCLPRLKQMLLVNVSLPCFFMRWSLSFTQNKDDKLCSKLHMNEILIGSYGLSHTVTAVITVTCLLYPLH